MALINYLTRVHFGDGVLQEAIRSELERLNIRRPLVLFENAASNTEHLELSLSAINSSPAEEATFPIPNLPEELAAREASEDYRSQRCDGIVGIGSGRVMHFAKLMRLCIVFEGYVGRLSKLSHGQRHLKDAMPPFIAAPDLSGISASISQYARVLLNNGCYDLVQSEKLRADVVICDPIVSLQETHSAVVASATDALSLCVDAFLASDFNPPADAMAVDGISRLLSHKDKLSKAECDLEARRQLMVSNIHAALALEKGVGNCELLTDYMMSHCKGSFQQGEIKRLAMPKDLQNRTPEQFLKIDHLSDRLQLPSGLSHHIDLFLEELPLPSSLSELGIDHAALEHGSSSRGNARHHAYPLTPECVGLLHTLPA